MNLFTNLLDSVDSSVAGSEIVEISSLTFVDDASYEFVGGGFMGNNL